MQPMNKIHSTKLTLALLVVMVVLVLNSSLAFAQGGARVYLQPVESNADTLVVEVMAENVSELYGAEFRLKYDPAVIAVQDFKPEQDGVQIEVGTLLPADKGFVVANTTDEAEGTVTFAMTLLNPAPAANGSGPLARVSFTILQSSASTINVEHAKLVAVDLQTIPSETSILSIGDDVEPQASTKNDDIDDSNAPAPVNPPAAASSSGFPWWIVAAVIMVLGILALGGFIVMGGLNKPNAATPSPQHSKIQRPPTYPSGARPSAFKNQLPTD
jgi:hypothetical protein